MGWRTEGIAKKESENYTRLPKRDFPSPQDLSYPGGPEPPHFPQGPAQYSPSSTPPQDNLQQ